jgi:hypothetical protein
MTLLSKPRTETRDKGALVKVGKITPAIQRPNRKGSYGPYDIDSETLPCHEQLKTAEKLPLDIREIHNRQLDLIWDALRIAIDLHARNGSVGRLQSPADAPVNDLTGTALRSSPEK